MTIIFIIALKMMKNKEGIKMGGYVVVRNSMGSTLGEYPVNTSKPIAQELVRIIQEEYLVFEEGDTISFESK